MLVGTTNRMRNVIRYSTCHRQHNETLAEHHYYTALFSALIAKDIGVQVNTEIVMLKALVHDVEESVSGDFMRSFKHSSPELKAAIEKGSEAFVYSMFNRINSNGAFDGAWKNAKDHSLEGRIVKFADFLSVLSYIYQELASGNKLIIENND